MLIPSNTRYYTHTHTAIYMMWWLIRISFLSLSLSLPNNTVKFTSHNLQINTIQKNKKIEVKALNSDDVVANVRGWAPDVRNRRQLPLSRCNHRPRRQCLGPELQLPSGFPFFSYLFTYFLAVFFFKKNYLLLSYSGDGLFWFIQVNRVMGLIPRYGIWLDLD